ncbi:glycosyltransferase family 2 protein [Winogradskyella litorisediminis]|uniref:Glycosyltransferase family 2 protein n=1 Tax=Winogradskyella litorisediminis TaxID=1156618 RepID=A0ABW3N9Z2_9FLAO
MLFSFLKYLQPTHYFGLKTKKGYLVFPVVDDFINSNFEKDTRYKSHTAIDYDQSWRAIQGGYVNYTETISEIEELSVFDNYVFSRKYFSKAWVIYVLFIRILSFKNPFKELSAFFKTAPIKRHISIEEQKSYDDYSTFESEFLKAKPFVSVIIPTLNRYAYLKDVLSDLEQQDYTNFEVLVIDQSEPFQKDFYNDYKLDLKVEYQQEKALWLARNTAIKKAQGHYILLFDDDSRVAPNWVFEHLKVLDFFKADISSGVSISKVGDNIPAHYNYFKISDQLDTGNVLLKTSIFKDIGLFDRQFEKQRMGDGEFGLRAFLNGYKNISNPYAKRLHLKVNSGGLREMGSWDAFRTKNMFQPRPIPSVLYFYRRYFGRKRALLSVLRTVPISVVPYKYKGHKPMLVLSGVIAIILSPLIIFQITKSWRLSSKKLKQGPKIELL